MDGFTQKRTDNLVQFSGVILTADSLNPVSFANIAVDGSYRGTIADMKGFFSIVARKGERLVFSAVGYKKAYYNIPDSLSHNRYSLFQVMEVDTITLTETFIYPWPTKAQFRQAFLSMEVPDDDMERARRNLAYIELRDAMRVGNMDAQMNYQSFVNKQFYKNSYRGMEPPSLTGGNNPLTNPFAWAKFFDAWQKGQFKR